MGRLDKRLFVRPENRWGDVMNVYVGDVLQGCKVDRSSLLSPSVVGIHVNSDEFRFYYSSALAVRENVH
jgi:hypothetical protein